MLSELLAAMHSYWTVDQVVASVLVFMHLVGALALGLVVGYERSYHGRAAGMRTYGLVCMASAALTVIAGFPTAWYGGHHAAITAAADPTRVMQGIVTGIGFLGAGVIMKEGFTISGLTSAASIWSASAIGILVGVGFYPAAILLAVLSALSMMWVTRLENALPSRQAVAVEVRFAPGRAPCEATLRATVLAQGYEIAEGSVAVGSREDGMRWHFVAVALGRRVAAPIATLGEALGALDGAVGFDLSYARN